MSEGPISSNYVPLRVRGGYFKPHPETIWPAPDGGDATLGEVPDYLLLSAWWSYVTLVTHPCGLDMLREVRRQWKKLVKKEAARG